MNEPNDLNSLNFDTLTPAQFEAVLPELFSAGNSGKVSEDPRLASFLHRNPDCAALVHDLEAIAEAAKKLFEPIDDPSDSVWDGLSLKLSQELDEFADESPS